MSKLLTRLAGFFSSRNLAGIDKQGNRYFTRKEEIDGLFKEKRWVVFKGEDDPTSIPVEWICWLNGQRKQAPTPEEMAELEVRRERVKQNIALLKKEEEEKRAKEGHRRKGIPTGEAEGPDLKSFIEQFQMRLKVTKLRKHLVQWTAQENRRARTQLNQEMYQSLLSPRDLEHPLLQGHGNHQHE